MAKKQKQRKDSATTDQVLRRMIGDRRGMKGIGDGTRAPSFSTGTYSKGVLYVPKSVIDSVSKPKSTRSRPVDDQATLPTFARQGNSRGGHTKKKKGGAKKKSGGKGGKGKKRK